MTSQERALHIVIYSDDSSTRKAITGALGTRLATDLAHHEIHEFATGDALRAYVDGGARVDLFILDGEAAPEGGLGIARQLKDEVFECPPVLAIIGRQADAWLAAWSRAEASVSHPVDPFTLARTAADLIRARISAIA